MFPGSQLDIKDIIVFTHDLSEHIVSGRLKHVTSTFD